MNEDDPGKARARERLLHLIREEQGMAKAKRMGKHDLESALFYLRETAGLDIRATRDSRPGRFEVQWENRLLGIEEMTSRDVWMLARGHRIATNRQQAGGTP